MKRAFCSRMLLVVCIAVCFAQTTFAGSFKNVNHKGYNTLAPENTLPAYMLSAEMGYQFVETDISFTSDGVPVLLHNPNINAMARNPDGSEITQEDVRIDSLTYEGALWYDFTKGMEAYNGTKIARLDDFLDLCRKKSLHPYLELKENGAYTKDAFPAMADVIKTTTINKRPTNVKVSAKGGKVTVRLPKIKRKALLRKTRAVLRLQKNTTYYIRVRYRGKDGGVSHWSKVKRVRTR